VNRLAGADAGSPPGLRLHRTRVERFFHPLGDFAQVGIARLAARTAGIEIALEAVALRPMFGQELEARVLDRLDRLGELGLRPADLRQDQHQAPLRAAPGELAGERQRRPQIVARDPGRQEDDVAVLGDLGRKIIGEAAGVGDDEIGDAVLAAQFLQALERARVDFRLKAGARSRA
jgi:hypothetical protein